MANEFLSSGRLFKLIVLAKYEKCVPMNIQEERRARHLLFGLHNSQSAALVSNQIRNCSELSLSLNLPSSPLQDLRECKQTKSIGSHGGGALSLNVLGTERWFQPGEEMVSK